jgi:hypothetical protein
LNQGFWNQHVERETFLIEILRRKLNIVANRYRKSQIEFERYAVLAVSSLYGIDILEDNIEACRKRLFELFEAGYKKLYKEKYKKKNVWIQSSLFSLVISSGVTHLL